MKLLAAFTCVPLVVVGGAWALSDEAGTVYPMPVDQVFAKVDDISLQKGFPQAGPGLENIYVRKESEPGQWVRWTALIGGQPVGHIVAKLLPEGEKSTRVVVDFGVEERAGKNKIADLLAREEVVRDIVRMHLQEEIDSRIEGRLPDLERVERKIERYRIENPGKVMRYQQSMMKVLEGAGEQLASERSELGLVRMSPEQTVAARERAIREQMRRASEPMIDTRPR